MSHHMFINTSQLQTVLSGRVGANPQLIMLQQVGSACGFTDVGGRRVPVVLMSVGLPSVCLSVPAVQEQKVCTASVDRQTHHNSLIPSQRLQIGRVSTGSDIRGGDSMTVSEQRNEACG